MSPGVGEQEPFSLQTPLAAALARYLEQISARKSVELHEREQRKARQIATRLGNLPLGEVTAMDLAGYRDHRLRQASAPIVQGDLDLLRELFEVVIGTWGVALEGNPVHGISAPLAAPDRSHTLGAGELVRLLAACDRRPSPLLGWIVRIALQTAMSKDEILKIRQEDLDLKARILTIPRTLSRASRQVALSREAVGLFRDALSYPERPDDEDLLFFGAMGSLGVRRPLAIDKAFRAVVLQARLKGFRFSDLRQEALSRLRAAGLSEVEVFTLAGMSLPRGGGRPVKPAVMDLVARLDAVGFGIRRSGRRGM
ncbi:MAG: tyrosine-type recombinase/integrase [Magnetococcales bacterium]|nr:tyrosine-type recombinase/integrase [Magnetococcales bacterium]